MSGDLHLAHRPVTQEEIEHSCPLCRPAIWRKAILDHIVKHALSIEFGKRARAQAKAMTPAQRHRRAKHAARARWAPKE
jgi:hypothetical protein